jgi:hypothetical protein
VRHGSIAFTTILAFGCRSTPVDESPISTDRPGFLFASSVVPRGVVQLEMATPNVTWTGSGDEHRTTSISAQARYGATDELELGRARHPGEPCDRRRCQRVRGDRLVPGSRERP